jgi:hypothetical protein
MGWIIEIAKLLGYALATSVVYVGFTTMLGVGNAKATGWGVIRVAGYEVMLVGAITIVLGFVLTRLEMVSDGAKGFHFILR